MAHSWDPERYLAFADERGRPFVELVARIDADAPRPGRRPRLRRRQPDRAAGPAVARGAGARRRLERGDDRGGAGRRGRRVRVGDIVGWRSDRAGRRTRLERGAPVGPRPPRPAARACVDAVAPGGWLAFQVPGNFDEPSHTLRRELAAEPPYAEHTRRCGHPDAHDAATYLQALRGLGCEVDAWETTYLHVLHGRGPRLHLGQRHRRPADPAGAARRPAPGVRGGVQASPARGLPRARRCRRAAVPPGVRGGADERLDRRQASAGSPYLRDPAPRSRRSTRPPARGRRACAGSRCAPSPAARVTHAVRRHLGDRQVELAVASEKTRQPSGSVRRNRLTHSPSAAASRAAEAVAGGDRRIVLGTAVPTGFGRSGAGRSARAGRSSGVADGGRAEDPREDPAVELRGSGCRR